jgi:hypothetical protein
VLEGVVELAPRQELNLGAIRLEPSGRLELRVVPAPGLRPLDLRVRTRDARGRRVHDLTLPDPEGHLPLALAMSVGEVTVFASAAGCAPLVRRVRVEEDATARAELQFEPGVACALRFVAAEGTPLPTSIDLLVRTRAGEPVLERTVRYTIHAPDAPFVATLDLLPGEYELEVDAGELSARGSWTVFENAGPPAAFLLEPR